MDAFITEHEAAIRLGLYLAILLLMGLWETLAARRPLSISRGLRWLNNLGLVALDGLLLRLIFPTAAVGLAALAGERGWGLFHELEAPYWLALLGSLVALDFVVWLQHVMFHAVPALWRLHRVHHADLDFDTTTGLRFHPIEILLSMLIKASAIVLLGPPLAAVVIFEVVLNGMAMFNHGNVRLPLGLDRWLRWLVVTPDMHRVHHSIEDDETNSNFGFNLSLWDRLFGTYRDQPRGGHEGMTIGIRDYREPRTVTWLPGLLWMPFQGRVSDYAINRRRWQGPKD